MSAAKILIIEDEPLISMMLEDFIDALGHEVAGMAGTLQQGLEFTAKGGFDAAILDINLNNQPCWPVADALDDAGIPFLLASGGQIEASPQRYADRTYLAKPYTLGAVEEALDGLLEN